MRFSGRIEHPGEWWNRFRSEGVFLLLFFLFGLGGVDAAPDFSEAEGHFIAGRHGEAIAMAEEVLALKGPGEEWRALLVDALMATGRYTNALAVMEEALVGYPRSVKLRLQARDVFRYNGDVPRGDRMLQEINQLAGIRMWAYQDAENLVVLGRAAVLLGADPRRVLEQFFDRAKKAAPESRNVHLAIGQLALDKSDSALAAKAFQEGLKRFPDDPDLHFGLASAFANSNRGKMVESLMSALAGNTNHVGSYLMLADHLIDGEDYAAAEETLESVFEVNPWSPRAWAYQAVLEHLRASPKGEMRSREKALRYWSTNPEVDHLIGKKLSQKYRFQEAAAYQRRALGFDPTYLPASIQLAQDLLRLGEETEGWQLADLVYEQDGYNVAAFNLVTLQETIDLFQTLTNRDFILRMATHEAEVYGEEALRLLQEAKDHLCAKYGVELDRPTTVEIFPEPKDFGVRTFGIPDNPGFLGVCFGSVITANSPASQGGNPANWKAVLWHEFCHVVTLQMTRNKMPRWLSEGISVHEELAANPSWGQIMTPRYRSMVLGGGLTPVGELSAAFLTPKSGVHLQFAYYESALVVEFLIGRHGLESLRQVLRDLAEGREINDAIAERCAPLEEIEKDFEAFARARAEALGPELDWEEPAREELADPDWRADHMDNYHVLMSEANDRMRSERWEEAREPLEKLIRLYPEQNEPDNAYSLLALVHRKLDQPALEREVLSRLAERAADDLDAYSRLMTLGSEEKDWEAVAINAERHLAVNPLMPSPHRFLGLASEELGRDERAIQSYRTLLRLDPPDPAEAHFRLAKLLHKRGDESAWRHLLQALEEAPRFREAHRLLLELDRGRKEAAGL